MKPLRILLFTVTVFLLLAGTMWITPDDGIDIGGFTFHMPEFKEMIPGNEVQYADVSELLEHQFDLDSVSLPDAGLLTENPEEIIVARASYDSLVQAIHKIEIGDSGCVNLQRVFRKMHEGKPVRIMHYGDSQIEGDRMTSFIRFKLQSKFGGTGPGLRAALQPYDFQFSAAQVGSSNWKRYPIYGKVDSLVNHNRYGVMGAFSRYAPIIPDSVEYAEPVYSEAEITISKTQISYMQTRKYEKFRLFYGNAKKPVYMELYANGALHYSDTLVSGQDYGMVQCILPDTTNHIYLKFSGWDSPDIYGIDLSSPHGITVDNIALRGSSGTIFTQSNYTHSANMYNDLDPDLFILQFGGNVMPYIKDQKAVDNYGRWFKNQITRLRNICPDAAFIVIGPSDMSTKIKDKYVTYDVLPAVVKSLKMAAITSGCGYWDMYEAMGGHNSMPSWVNAEPALAGPDYVHFTTRGAKLVANMFYNALIYEYNKKTTDTL